MRFFYNKLILWLRNGQMRIIEFQPNKINVVTGGSGTGKSEIISIIDYCLFSSHAVISEEVINENVSWYGINFTINEFTYTVARKAIENNEVSLEYYFSSVGKIPEKPFRNISEKDIKKILEKEFNITENTIIPYGGKKLKQGSKISIKYFMMFNTQPGEIIDNSESFYEKQTQENYKEALPRIFDIAFGIDTIENKILSEKKIKLEKEILKLEKKQELLLKEANLFSEEIAKDLYKAKKLGLISNDIPEDENSIDILENILYKDIYNEVTDTNIQLRDELVRKKSKLINMIRNYDILQREYNDYIGYKKNEESLLKPIEYLKSNYEQLLFLPETAQLVRTFESELKNIKEKIKLKKAFSINISSEKSIIKKQIEVIDAELRLCSQPDLNEINTIEKIQFIGALKYKLDLYKKNRYIDSYDSEIENIRKQLNDITIKDISEERANFINVLEYCIQKNLDIIGEAFGNYEGYRAIFDYNQKILKLRAPLSKCPSRVGSSSNHMFMHLSLFLGLHEANIMQNAAYIPQYLILDQPSRPYYSNVGESIVKKDTDVFKIRKVMELLDEFIKRIKIKYNKDFQIILLEHVPTTTYEGLENYYLSAEFRSGNALIND